MPANISHFLVCLTSLKEFSKTGTATKAFSEELFNDNLSNNRTLAWALFGSIAPDLFFYQGSFRALWKLYAGKLLRYEMPEGWSYLLHSAKTNELPFRLFQITFRDAEYSDSKYNLEDIDYRKIAFILGWLTHIAADQMLHRRINDLAGPYYRSSKFRELHRELEIQLDYHLYQKLYRPDHESTEFMKQDFSKWTFSFDQSFHSVLRSILVYFIRNPISFLNSLFLKQTLSSLRVFLHIAAQHVTEEWFVPFIQRGFLETYGRCPNQSDIYSSVFNLGMILRTTGSIKHYKSAKRKYEKNYLDGSAMEYFKGHEWQLDFTNAVALAIKYIACLCTIYCNVSPEKLISTTDEDFYFNTVNDEDLACPALID